MIFFPIATDAPIYHWPIVTVLMIVLNVAIFFSPESAADTWIPILLFDEINPWAWLTCNFQHAGIFHLIGNMLFLWPFGLVVEGKLGWWRFLLVYLGIGLVFGAALQLSMRSIGVDGGALGASAVLFGLLGLCVVWAPKNDFKVFYLLLMHTGIVDVSILTFCGLYLFLQLVEFALAGFNVSSALLHLMGFAVGFPLGIVMLKRHWVDCEGWDLLAVWGNRLPTAIKDPREQKAQAEDVDKRYQNSAQQELEEARASALSLIQNHLAEGRTGIAHSVYVKHGGTGKQPWQLPDPLMASLTNAVVTQKMWPEAITLLRQMMAHHPAQAAAARLKLAQILIQIENRPKQALAVLGKLPADLNEALAKRRDQLTRLAQKEIEEGTLETLVEDW